jgi:DNA replication protein DnaC
MKTKSDELELLIEKLKWLRLPGMAGFVTEFITESSKKNLTVLDVLHRLADEEKKSRMDSAVKRRIKAARFPQINTVDGFDFDFDPCRKKLRARYLALHDLGFIEKGINPLFIGRPGTGKTFLARAMAFRACQAARRVVFTSAPKMLNALAGAELHGNLDKAMRPYVRAELLVIDDFAVLEMDPTQAKLAFQVISERYEYCRATACTTNRPFKDWPKVFPDALTAEILAKRLTERCEHFVLDGKSYSTHGIARSIHESAS